MKLFQKVYTIFVVLPMVGGAFTRDDESRLLDNLIAQQDKRIKPHSTSNETFHVAIAVGILQLLEVDQKNQIFDAYYSCYQMWTDTELAWNSTAYNGIKALSLPEETIWTPSIGLDNDVDLVRSKNSLSTTIMMVNSFGQVARTLLVNYRSSCDMSLRNFPFDKQNCTLTFSSWKYIGTELNLTIAYEMTGQNFQESSEFRLISMKMSRTEDKECCIMPIIKVHLNIVFERRPQFYLLNMILPCTLITMIAMFAFCIPPESGEKIGLGVTVLLSLSVFLLIVSEQMPPTTDFPLIGIYYFGVILIVTFSTGVSVMTLSLNHNASFQTKEVPQALQSLLFDKLAWWLCMAPLSKSKNNKSDKAGCKKLNKVGPSDDDNRSDTPDKRAHDTEVVALNPIDGVQSDGGLGSGPMSEILQFIRRIEDKKQEEQKQEDITEQWKYLGRLIDRILLVVFLFLNVVFTLWILLAAANG